MPAGAAAELFRRDAGAGPCGNCDTCLVPAQTWDGTVAAQKLLSAIYRLKRERNQRFGAGHVIDILLGKNTPKIVEQGHTSLTVFGIGAELTDNQWRGVVRQLLAQGFLAVDPNYSTLALSEQSGQVLSGDRKVLLRSEPARAAKAGRASRASGGSGGSGSGSGGSGSGSGSAVAVELSAGASELFEELRAWRAGIAREQGMPAYVIFHDATLRQIAAKRPTSLGDLSGISGVGEAKLAKYGQQVVDLLAQRPPEAE